MEFIVFSLSIFSLVMVFAYYRMAKRLRLVSSGFAQLYKDYISIQELMSVENTSNALLTDDDMHRENFIKFLSESRDWAFGYIEDVQSGLKKFIQEVEPQLEYYNKYGIVVDGMIPPHDFALKKISKEFDDLKKLLPEDSDDRR